MTRRSRLLLLLACLAGLSGCQASTNDHVFTSTIFEPMNIEVAEQVTKKRLWYYEIPVNHRLRLKFRNPNDQPPFQMSEFPATTMEWWDLKADQKDKVIDHGKVQFSGVPIIMKMSMRPAPEYPAELKELMPKKEASAKEASATQPAATQPAAAEPAPPLVVAVGSDGAISVGKHPIDGQRLTDLMKALVSETPERAVLIAAPADAPAARVTQIVELCKSAGVKTVGVQVPTAVAPPEGSPPAAATQPAPPIEQPTTTQPAP